MLKALQYIVVCFVHPVQNPDSAKPALPFIKPSHALPITWSLPNLRPSLYATLHSESPCEPLLICGKDGEEEGLQFIWSLHECSSSLLGWYWKDAPGFPPAKRQPEKPLGNILFRRRQILYSAHTHRHTNTNCSFLTGIFVLYFGLVAAAHFFIFSRILF